MVTDRDKVVLQGIALTDKPAGVLKDICVASGVTSVTVTSVGRTPHDQARVMYDNCAKYGVEHQRALYKAAGDQVIGVYAENKNKGRIEVIDLMEKKVLEVGPTNVSKHCSVTHWVFDVAPSSIPHDKLAEFIRQAKTHKDVSKVLEPPADPAVHIEIPRVSTNLPIT